MATHIEAGSPLAATLQNVMMPKLLEMGLSSGLEDTAMSEYIIMLLQDGKDQKQIADELYNDFGASLGTDESSTLEFTKWLFEHIQNLPTAAENTQPGDMIPSGSMETDEANGLSGQDSEMGGSGSTMYGYPFHYRAMLTEIRRPTGPKAMRNGNAKPRGRNMLGQVNKAMDRSNDSVLHRVRGTPGSGRINSHSREPPKGPRQQINRNAIANQVANGRGMPPMSMDPSMGMSNMVGMAPEQQMHMLGFYEQAASMFQMMFQQGQMGGAMMNPTLQQGNQQQRPGKPLADRISYKDARKGRQFNGQQNQKSASQTASASGDSQMEGVQDGQEQGNDTSMEVDGNQSANKDLFSVRCRFDLECTKDDCPFAHQSPASVAYIPSLDLTDTCAYGLACKNRKCKGKHPSPAGKLKHQAEQDCKFWAVCTYGDACTFRHPDMPACRNGPNCPQQPNCKFTHGPIMDIACRHNPCTNPGCFYKHTEGQQQLPPASNKWVANQQKEHVSERKFTDEGAEEELIVPAKDPATEAAAETIT
jgi:nuclear polyadenylated RNA-binding protein NAB2